MIIEHNYIQSNFAVNGDKESIYVVELIFVLSNIIMAHILLWGFNIISSSDFCV